MIDISRTGGQIIGVVYILCRVGRVRNYCKLTGFLNPVIIGLFLESTFSLKFRNFAGIKSMSKKITFNVVSYEKTLQI